MTAADTRFDLRTLLARPDLADLALEGVVRADAYRAAEPMHARVAAADLFDGAGASADRVDQLLHGEIFDGLERVGDRIWGQARRDGVVGWVALADLAPGVPLATHRVAAVDAALPLNALVVDGHPDVAAAALAPVGDFERDPVAVAERLTGAPHALGARSSRATDCAGLVQQALMACGRAAPRYADQQAALGQAVARDDARRGDLVVWLHADGGPGWSGHSALMLDADRVIHASGDQGGVVVEDLAGADARYRADGFAAPVFRRL